MAYEKKNGQFVCFIKQSKNNTPYFNGEMMLDGKSYWVTVFEKVAVTGSKYLSGVVEEKKVQNKPVEQVEQENNEWLENSIPF